ncbi:E3 ubiquitin-protein ligase TRIM39 [Nibea albiflora]|uniref:E3 ubiquitin-protein ligase TRIM39 n=1 Tax=Nibea albiflora TaxID=240163 RepID=A0ACB7EVD5_NIBAL|nr:E3 ubiquitin-protein ligase TRIM39 [Nibea albiflora]
MASATNIPCEEQFRCSICLDVFTEPVSTPCGHNYCKTCIMGYWASKNPPQCPLCLKKFRKRPQLQVNTEFRDMVEHFNKMRVTGEYDILAKPGEVPCDICCGPKLKAQKTCLVCLTSFCQHHLEPHQRVATLKKHQLIGPVSDLQDRVCQKHDKMFELFCEEDQMCVCFMCLKDDHASHKAVPLEHAFRQRKAELIDSTSEIKSMEKMKSWPIEVFKYSIKLGKEETEKQIADIAEVFNALVVSLQRRVAELNELVQEKQKAAERQAKDHVTQLEQEVTDLRRKRSEMEQLLQSEDHLHLLRSYHSLSSPAHTGVQIDPPSHSTPRFRLDISEISQQTCVEMVKKAVGQMEKMLSNEMETLIHEVRLSDGRKATEQRHAAETLMTDEFIREVWNPPRDKLMMIQQCDAVDVTLDPYTANSKLMVSEDGKQLSYHKGRLFFTTLFGKRFEYHPFVLGKDGFSSGRFYYEVRVSGNMSYVLGVAKESITREEFGFPLPENGCWTFTKITGQFQEEFRCHFCEPPLELSQGPQTVGVFVDYEKGEVSFYDVDARTLIYSYTGCAFSETTTALRAFLYSMTGTPLSNRPKLYPILGIYRNDDILEITPVRCNASRI